MKSVWPAANKQFQNPDHENRQKKNALLSAKVPGLTFPTATGSGGSPAKPQPAAFQEIG